MKTKKNNSPSLAKLLNAWYRKHARDLPWRRTQDPYKIWISEVMLQQTTVSAVIPYYQRWIQQYPTVKSVADSSIHDLLNTWQGLGYYQRAKNLHKASQLICRDYAGQIPDKHDHLRALPGFGPYTTGAVLSIAFDKRYPIVDANVRRVIMRILAIEGEASPKIDGQINEYLLKVLPARNLRTFNQALMELGALVCRSKEPVCGMCPIRRKCVAYEKGVQEIIPKTKKKIIQDLHVAIGIIIKKDKYFIQKRPSKGLLADLWEFPGGKIEAGETAVRALKREIVEEVGVVVTKAKRLMSVRHYYTQYRVNLQVFQCQVESYPAESQGRKWIRLDRLSDYPMPSGSAKIVDKLLKL